MKKLLSLALCLVLALSLTMGSASAAHFVDQEDIQHSEAVDNCVDLNIIGGYADGTFRPKDNVTRAELSKMLSVALNGGSTPVLTSTGSTFTDSKGHWAEQYIEYCVQRDIVAGVGGGRFNPNGYVTGTQAAKMLLVILGFDPAAQGYVGSSLWAENINTDASDVGLYDGLGSFDPSSPLTRDQAAQMIWNALNSSMVEWRKEGNTIHIDYLNETLLEHCYPNFSTPVDPAPDDPTPDVPETPSTPNKTKTLIDYIGMTKSEIAQIWGNDYIESQGGEMGADSTLYYKDSRIPAEFSLNDDTVVLVFCSPKTMDSDFTLTETFTGRETYTQLLENGIAGDFVTEDNDPEGVLGWNYFETAAFSFSYEGKFVYFSWLNEDPHTTQANFVFVG